MEQFVKCFNTDGTTDPIYIKRDTITKLEIIDDHIQRGTERKFYIILLTNTGEEYRLNKVFFDNMKSLEERCEQLLKDWGGFSNLKH